MDLRIFTEPQQGATYDDLLRVAKTTEDAGYDAFFRSDHVLKMGSVSGLPGPTDAWITLAGLARETSRIKLGTLVTAATFRHPSVLAISVAQVDRMSGGRVEFGFGAGWFAEEHTAYGIPLPEVVERFDRYAEQLEIITGLWETPEGETFDFSGKHYRLVDAPALPKPAQRPRPPVIIGGAGKKRTPALAARFAQEFNLPFSDSATATAQFERVAAAAREIGRDPNEIVRSAAQVLCVGRDDAEVARRAAAIGREVEELKQNGLTGTPAEIVDKIARYREETGITRMYLQVLDLADLDHIELVAAEVAPQLG
ncbi:LLM class F420-dependent oxidoreductase [Nocardia terpenica]|uniref:LLM class F420-dependent oxidoreductase n=1 Tax=Nocardia terpenica TaxID=455432 RepID=A0A164ICS8_9NOCA|nr:LLM class F420-dependent oxidoreductase [Nocardia terpenica]KZM69317.1 LLM class F420-dependent oxidoreductase [Nocardia terpenica]MBF6065008.1 LLM class F420-dependent oxidoreductase [Nocardia terpenica]MBF6108065.1 LLM class F420-dependent oxidoreductase [Nocardia terpenica]MBF6115280.1 LLM class F420-dependent oxidoreductase [Nocardia terpenica]MBF6122602.1 LLM class F420-dependent oxidoreductase [Nocardia terpenica]